MRNKISGRYKTATQVFFYTIQKNSTLAVPQKSILLSRKSFFLTKNNFYESENLSSFSCCNRYCYRQPASSN